MENKYLPILWYLKNEKAFDSGCNNYISKPINKPELESLIQKYFKK